MKAAQEEAAQASAAVTSQAAEQASSLAAELSLVQAALAGKPSCLSACRP